MRIAIISDIHGNLSALEAVLKDIDQIEPDRIVCLGDLALVGPQPGEAIARVRDLGCPVIMGNGDEWLLQPPWEEHGETEDRQKQAQILLWGAEQVTDEDRVFLRTFQPTIEVSLGDATSLLCYHGSPRSNVEAIFAATPPDELERMVEGVTATVLVGGHTHVPMVRRHDNRMTVLNPGSVGLPFNKPTPGAETMNPAWAEYGILAFDDDTFSIESRRVRVDLDKITTAARESGMPHAEWWIVGWTSPVGW